MVLLMFHNVEYKTTIVEQLDAILTRAFRLVKQHFTSNKLRKGRQDWRRLLALYWRLWRLLEARGVLSDHLLGARWLMTELGGDAPRAFARDRRVVADRRLRSRE